MGKKLKKFLEDLYFYISSKFSNKLNIKGKCKMCGACCKTIVFYVGDNQVKTKEQFELLKKWDKKYNNFEIFGVAPDGALYFKCKALDSTNKCKVYHFRSLACRMYPKYHASFFTRGDEFKNGCGYYLEPKKKFKEFIK